MPIYLVPQARRRVRRAARLGSFSDWFPSWSPLTWIPASTVESELGKAYTYVTAPIGSPGTIPGSNLSDVLYNAATGHLSQNQKNAIVQQAQSDCVRAGGGDPGLIAQCQAQSASDINAVLIASNSDPSQSSSPVGDYLAIGAVALAALFAVSRFL